MKADNGVISLLLMLGVLCHHQYQCIGYLLNPASRAEMWKRGYGSIPINYPFDEPLCGGHLHQELHVLGNPYGKGRLSGSFLQGEIATFDLDETNLDAGFFEFRLCPTTTVSIVERQPCFDQHPIYLDDGSLRHYVRRSTTVAVGTSKQIAKVRVRIPSDVSCDTCVLQYQYYHVPVPYSQPVVDPSDIFYGCCDIRIQGRQYESSLNHIFGGVIIWQHPQLSLSQGVPCSPGITIGCQQTVQTLQPLQTVQTVQQRQPLQFLQPVQNLQPVQTLQRVQSLQPVQTLQRVQSLQPVQNLQRVQTLQQVQTLPLCNPGITIGCRQPQPLCTVGTTCQVQTPVTSSCAPFTTCGAPLGRRESNNVAGTDSDLSDKSADLNARSSDDVISEKLEEIVDQTDAME